MASIEEQFVEFVVKSLVNHPEDVKVERTIDKLGVLLKLTVNPEDLGRVIGKRGATAQSIRTLLRALGTKNEARFNLKIVDNGEPRPERQPREEAPKAEEEAPKEADEPKEEVEEEEESEPKVEEVEDSEDEDEKVEEEEEEKESLSKKTLDDLKDLDDLEI